MTSKELQGLRKTAVYVEAPDIEALKNLSDHLGTGLERLLFLIVEDYLLRHGRLSALH